jgi:2-alkyl-3-oxoalkanoate reductase
VKVLVTGGGGFLGKVIIHQLIDKGYEPCSLARNYYQELSELGVKQIKGDLADRQAVSRAVKGCNLVFHVGAKAGIWGKYKDFYATNVTGTENVIDACHQEAVPYLVYTSSPSVIFDRHDIEGADESLPYPAKFLAHYPSTKALAEQKVLAANSAALATVVLRPHLIWGPGDNHLIPAIIAQARAGRLRIVGRGDNLVDTVYVDNAALAHLQAAEALIAGAPLSGKAYFITQDEPVKIIDMINRILELAGLDRINSVINPTFAYYAGAFFELFYRLLPIPGQPLLTRFLALELSRHHWFSIEAAKKDFNYAPIISTKEGLQRLEKCFMIPVDQVKPY